MVDTCYSFESRAAFVADVSSVTTPFAMGSIVCDGAVFYRKIGGSTAILPGLPEWVPLDNYTPLHFGAVGNGSNDDTSAVNAAIDSCLANGLPLFWGWNQNYLCLDVLTNFLNEDAVFEGSAKISRGSRTVGIGAGWTNQFTIYVSPEGTGDGITVFNPTTIEKAFQFVRRLGVMQSATNWTISLAAGTYSMTSRLSFVNFPLLQKSLVFRGQTDETNVPTSILNCSVVAFYGINNFSRLFLEFRDIKFVAQQPEGGVVPASAIDIRGDKQMNCNNLHAEGFSDAAFIYRNGCVDQRGGVIRNCAGGIRLQDIYGEVGSNSTLEEEGIEFESIGGEAVQISRGSKCYVRKCSFTNVGIGVAISRHGRCRTVSNSFTSWNDAAISLQDGTAIWNDLQEGIDTFSAGVVGKITVSQAPDASVPSFMDGVGPAGHRAYKGPAVSTPANMLRNNIAGPTSGLGPFRMPGYWLQSPRAEGHACYEVRIPANDEVTFQVTGSHPGIPAILAGITVPAQASEQLWYLDFWFTGAYDTSGKGRYRARAQSALGTYFSAGETGPLANPSSSFAAGTVNVARFYVQSSMGMACTVYQMKSDIAF